VLSIIIITIIVIAIVILLSPFVSPVELAATGTPSRIGRQDYDSDSDQDAEPTGDAAGFLVCSVPSAEGAAVTRRART